MATAAVAEPAPVGEAEPVTEVKKAGPQTLPIAAPTSSSKPAERPALTADQQKHYDWLLEQVKAWKDVPSTKGKGGPITEGELQWLTRECLLRYLRATKWQPQGAATRLRETLTWRREYGVDALTAELMSPENETGKQVLLGFDRDARPCHIMSPRRQNTAVSPRQLQHMVYMLERDLDMMPPGQEKLALLIDFKQGKTRSNTAPGIGQGKEALNILQNHYPERLGRALIVNVPWIVWGFFKLITPFIDPLTREKLKFNEDVSQYIPEEQLWNEFGGKLDFEYDHAVYWPALDKLCAERRAERTRRWVSGGKLVGEHEDYLNGLAPTGAAGTAPAEKAEAGGADKEKPVVADAVDPVAAGEAKMEESKPEDLKLEELKLRDEKSQSTAA